MVVNCPIVSVGFHAGIWHKPILGMVKVWWPGFPCFREFRAVLSSGFQVVRVFSGGGSHVGMVVHATQDQNNRKKDRPEKQLYGPNLS